MTNSGLISVIIPTYNRGLFLPRTLNSVYQQHSNTEIILIDDGSTDETEKIVRLDFPEVRYYFQPNQGVSSARNRGIRLARGNWIAFLDSDDVWHPNKLQKQISSLQNEPNYLICHTDEIWYRNGERVNPKKKHQKYGGWILQHCLLLCIISPSSVLIHRKVFDALGHFDETLPACEDYDLWLRLCAQYPVLFINEPLLDKHAGHQDQLSKKYWGMDRFRIKALQKTIDSGILSQADLTAALEVLRQKIHVYLLGAEKRNKSQEQRHYEALLQQYCI